MAALRTPLCQVSLKPCFVFETVPCALRNIGHNYVPEKCAGAGLDDAKLGARVNKSTRTRGLTLPGVLLNWDSSKRLSPSVGDDGSFMKWFPRAGCPLCMVVVYWSVSKEAIYPRRQAIDLCHFDWLSKM